MNLDMSEFHQTFFDESADLLADMESLLLRLEEAREDPTLVGSIFRCAHSIKGGAATFGFTEIAHFTHSLETLLDRMRTGLVEPGGVITQLLFESVDHLKALLSAARGESHDSPSNEQLIFQLDEATASAGVEEEEWDEDALRAEIARMVDEQESGGESGAPADQDWDSGGWTEGSPHSSAGGRVNDESDGDRAGGNGIPQKRRFSLAYAPAKDIIKSGLDPVLPIRRLTQLADVVEIRCDTSSIPTLEQMDPESCYVSWNVLFETELPESAILELFEFVSEESVVRLEEAPKAASVEAVSIGGNDTGSITAPISALLPQSASKQETPGGIAASNSNGARAEGHGLRVSTNKVDKLINLVGELIINQSMLNDAVRDFDMSNLPRLLTAVADLDRTSRELQERVMGIRMVPIKHAFGRFPRMVRDVAAAIGKRIDLRTVGEETELDKNVIEAVADPLTHLVRNSMDHGLESPEERLAAGKPETGTIVLNAYHDGGTIVIEVTDDGRGLDRDKILRKAIERGIVGENESLSDDAVNGLIFHPGFSTAAVVTDLSGRGVGMDIVKRGVESLGGSLSLTSTPGQGTRFRIRVPLTLAILEGLSISVGREVYIIPITSIVESLKPRVEDVRTVAGRAEVVLAREEVLPLVRLHAIFGTTDHVSDPTQGLVVIIENDGKKAALLIDELIGQTQVVIKSLETNYSRVDAIAGATILGDGRVALILDVAGLIRRAERAVTMNSVARQVAA